MHPASTLSNSSTFPPSQQPTSPSNPAQPQLYPNHLLNPALQILSRRAEIAAEADAEFTRLRGGGEGRRFLDVGTIREVLAMRDGKGMAEGEIEGRLGLRRGVVGRLGQRGVVGEAGLGAEKEGGGSL